MRRWIATTAFFAAYASAGYTGAQSPAPATSAATAVLRQAAQAGTLAGLKWPRFPYYRDELTSLYTRGGWQPIWSSNNRPTAAARSAIDVLRTAQERGLHPEDYDAARLDQEFQKLSSGSGSERDIGWFDVALSIGLLRHISDVHIGRINPKNLSVGINVQPKKLDLAREIAAAIVGGRIPALVQSAEPRFSQYRGLKAAYARYSKLAADPSLPTIATTRSIRPGDAFDQTAQLRRRLAAFGDLPAGRFQCCRHDLRCSHRRRRRTVSGSSRSGRGQRTGQGHRRRDQRLAGNARASARARAGTYPLAA